MPLPKGKASLEENDESYYGWEVEILCLDRYCQVGIFDNAKLCKLKIYQFKQQIPSAGGADIAVNKNHDYIYSNWHDSCAHQISYYIVPH